MSYEQYSLEQGHTKKRRFGLTKPRILIVVLSIVVCAVLIAHFVTHRTTHAAAAANADISARQVKSSTAPNPKPNASTQPPISTSAATQLVTNFYQKYSTAASKQSTRTSLGMIVQQYGTPNLIRYYNPGAGKSYQVDSILCAQAVPHGIRVFNVTSDIYSAQGTVSETYSTGPVNSNFTVIRQSKELKIDSIACSPPLVAGPGGA